MRVVVSVMERNKVECENNDLKEGRKQFMQIIWEKSLFVFSTMSNFLSCTKKAFDKYLSNILCKSRV